MLMEGPQTELSPLIEGSLICMAFSPYYRQEAIKAWPWPVLYA